MQPSAETKADILLNQDLFLLKLADKPIDEVESALLSKGYVLANEDSEVYLWAAENIRQFNLPDGMQRCQVVIPPARGREFYILHYRWDGKVHRLDSHAVYTYTPTPKAEDRELLR